MTSILDVTIGRLGGPPAEPIGRTIRRGLAGKFDFDRFLRVRISHVKNANKRTSVDLAITRDAKVNN